MNKLLRVLPVALYAAALLYAGCSGSDEPKPFSCSDSDLSLSLATNGDIDPTTCSANDGSVEVMATGGKEPYTYAMGTGSFGNNPLFSNLGAGTFLITVKDANECTKQLSVVLEVAGAPTLAVNMTPDTNCTAPGNGSLTATASNGAPPYLYKLDNGDFSANAIFENLASGAHTITVKDDAECTLTVSTGVSKGITGVNYVDDILPIFQSKCNFSGCHPDNGDWFTYSVAQAASNTIKAKTANGDMPKGGGAEQNGPLTATQKALIACWVDDGAPEN